MQFSIILRRYMRCNFRKALHANTSKILQDVSFNASVVLYLLCLSCMYCVIVLCVLLLQHAYFVYYCPIYLGDGLLARGQYPEGPATGHLCTGFAWFPCVCL